MRPEGLRDDIPLLADQVYLNTGSSGPSPRRVREAMHAALDDHAAAHAESPYGHEAEVADEARSAVASVLDTPADRVALTSNTTDGINVVSDLFDWGPDDAVVTTALEHPAGTLPWRRLEEVHDVDVRVVPTTKDGTLDVEEYERAVEGATLVCLSPVSWYGVRLPVRRLVSEAHDAGASVVADVAQTVGAEDVSVDAMGADYVAGTGHKWLLGPWGAGFLYVSGDAPRAGQTRAGYKSAPDPNSSPVLHDDARRFELSTSSPALLAGLAEAARVHEEVGAGAIADRVSRLVGRLEDGLGDRLVSSAAGLVRFRADSDPDAVVESLRDSGIVIRSLPDGSLRASVHAFNTPEDIDALLEAL